MVEVHGDYPDGFPRENPLTRKERPADRRRCPVAAAEGSRHRPDGAMVGIGVGMLGSEIHSCVGGRLQYRRDQFPWARSVPTSA